MRNRTTRQPPKHPHPYKMLHTQSPVRFSVIHVSVDSKKQASSANDMLQLQALLVLFHLGQLLLFDVGELVVQVLEIGLGGDVLEEFDEVALGVVVPMASAPAGFVHVGH